MSTQSCGMLTCPRTEPKLMSMTREARPVMESLGSILALLEKIEGDKGQQRYYECNVRIFQLIEKRMNGYQDERRARPKSTRRADC